VTDTYEPTLEDLQRIIGRNQFALNVLTDRVAALTRENVELMSIVDELQRDLAEARRALSDLKSSDDLLAQVTSDHAVVHPVPDDPARVPSG
jgi:chromosome segregation ATPase